MHTGKLAATASLGAALAFAWRRFLLGERSPFQSDVEFYHHPVTRELVEAWSQGRIPLWTDHVYMGFPYLADPQTAAWYPGTLLVAGLGPHAGTALFLVLHALLAAAGTLGLLRACGISWPAAWAAGLVVPLSGAFAHETQHPGLFAILCWMPAWLWATRALVRAPSARRIAVAAIPLAMMILAGTLQVLFGVAILFAFFVLGLGLDARAHGGAGHALRSLGAVTASQLLGLALTGVVLVPATAHLLHTARALGMAYEFASMGSAHPLELLGTFVNRAEALLARGDELGFGGASFFAGALVLPLALTGLLAVRRKLPLCVGLAVVTLVLLASGRHGAWHPALYAWMPGVVGSLRGVGRALGPAALGLALLAGLGLDRAAEPRVRRWLAGGLGLALLAHVAVLTRPGAPLAGPTLGSALVLAVAVAWCAAARRPALVRSGLAVLVALDLLAFGALDDVIEQSPRPPTERQLAGALHFPALEDIADGRFGAADERVALLRGFGGDNFTFHHDLAGFTGYNPLVTLQYLDFVHRVDAGSARPRTPLRNFVHDAVPDRVASPLFQASATRFLISGEQLEGEGLELLRRYPHPITRRPVLLYENTRALPRTYLATRTLRAESAADLDRLLGEGFDGRRATVYEGDIAPLDGEPAITPVRAVRPRPEELRVDLTTETPALLVVADSWYPGWRAWVDGAEAPVVRVNGQFRGVPVPAGGRSVRMRFEPATFRLGAALSLVGASVLALLAWAPSVHRARSGI